MAIFALLLIAIISIGCFGLGIFTACTINQKWGIQADRFRDERKALIEYKQQLRDIAAQVFGEEEATRAFGKR